MDEPESIAALSLAAREQLDNCTFVINCNLQRLDGPVRGNGRIVDELESVFAGAGWHVIKCLWSSDWDVLFARDHGHALMRAFAQTVDGQFQTLSAKDGAFNREVFFGQNDELKALVADLRDEDIDRLRRGGHDAVKIHAAFAAAVAHAGQPTVVLAKTMKGYAMGEAAQGRMTTHQAKKLDSAGLIAFRDRFALPMSDADTQALAFYKPADDSAEMRYLLSRRRALGGALPARRSDCAPVPVPSLEATSAFALHADGKEMSTTMAFVRVLGNLMKDPVLGPRVVPIVADEARTFGMASLFRQVGIYAPFGQLYQPEDSGSILSYREDKSGQILEEGITEAGALSSWTAAATSYSTHGLAMLPFYIYYSMFGFQRVGDLIWAAADQRARGFLIGATAGRTTLSGEGLQHQDGTSHLDRRDGAELQGLRPGVRRRARRHRRPRHARDARGAEGRLLLRDGDERERRPAVAAGRSARGRAARHVPLSRRRPRRRAPRPAARVGRDPRRGDQGRRRARGGARRRRRRLERDQLQRAGARTASPPRRRGATARPASCAATSASSSRRRAGRSSSPPTTCAPCPSRSAPSCRRAGAASRSAPTASAAATRAPRCARHFEVDAEAIVQAALRSLG